jgi:VIT1/CCC1 family predicted Fe2+/Mn2+ transporter
VTQREMHGPSDATGTAALVVGRLTGRPVLRSGLRQLLPGGLAIAVTFGVGHLIGAHGA